MMCAEKKTKNVEKKVWVPKWKEAKREMDINLISISAEAVCLLCHVERMAKNVQNSSYGFPCTE